MAGLFRETLQGMYMTTVKASSSWSTWPPNFASMLMMTVMVFFATTLLPLLSRQLFSSCTSVQAV